MPTPRDIPEKRPSKAGGKVVGVDEVGRGTWAGPVTACAFAVLEPRKLAASGLRARLADSKALSPARRREISDGLGALAERGAVAFAFGEASPAEIDRVNIRQATRLAMGRALEGLAAKLGAAMAGAEVLIDGKDGFTFPGIPTPRYVVRGDTKVREIMAASILAKVLRDGQMGALCDAFPGYGFAAHKGYGTAAHSAGLARLGPCAIHRMTFAPVRAATR